MQEAIGAQYMQRHLPKLEPFLRRVVSISLPLLSLLAACLQEFLMEFSAVFCL